jgi:hypothetical protein
VVEDKGIPVFKNRPITIFLELEHLKETGSTSIVVARIAYASRFLEFGKILDLRDENVAAVSGGRNPPEVTEGA